MATLSMIGLSMKDATNQASKEVFKNITNSFSMEINRRVNQGTPRGGGNIKGEDIKKISESPDIEGTVKRINSVADLADYDIIETKETQGVLTPDRIKKFKRAVMLTGVNDSAKENTLVESDKYKILMHKDLAEKNHLKVGDKITLKSNIYDADNEKGANETVEVEIKGLFDGHNKTRVTAAQELYENTLVTDIHTAAKVYGNTEDTAVYQDATFFVKGNKNLDTVIKDLGKLAINWKSYNLVKSSSNFPALQQSISGMYSIANKLFIGSIAFAGITVALLLFLWMNARQREIGVLLSIGLSKMEIFGQFVWELLFISLPAFVGAAGVAILTGKTVGNQLLASVTSSIAKQMGKQAASTGLGGGAEVDGFNKTLTSLEMVIQPTNVLYVVGFMIVVLGIALTIASVKTFSKNPKELLLDVE